jgi:hypothetical protein
MGRVRPEINQQESRWYRDNIPNALKKFENTIGWEAVDDIRNDDCIVALRNRIVEEVSLYDLNSRFVRCLGESAASVPGDGW